MAKKNPSTFFTIFSIVLVLLILGIYGVVAIHAKNIADILKQNVNIIVEIQDSLSQEQLDQIQLDIQSTAEVKSGSVRWIPKSEALDFMNDDLGETYLLSDIDNPFKDLFLFNVKKEFINQQDLDIIVEKVKAYEGIETVSYYGGVYDYLGKNIRRLSRILLLFGLVLSIFAFSLIYSTIYLSLYAERFKIRTMELVGSRWNQIRKPFIVKAIKLAVVSSIISVILLSAVLLVFYFQVDIVGEILNGFYVFLVFVFMLVFCLFITQLASYLVLNKYLGISKTGLYDEEL